MEIAARILAAILLFMRNSENPGRDGSKIGKLHEK